LAAGVGYVEVDGGGDGVAGVAECGGAGGVFVCFAAGEYFQRGDHQSVWAATLGGAGRGGRGGDGGAGAGAFFGGEVGAGDAGYCGGDVSGWGAVVGDCVDSDLQPAGVGVGV